MYPKINLPKDKSLNNATLLLVDASQSSPSSLTKELEKIEEQAPEDKVLVQLLGPLPFKGENWPLQPGNVEYVTSQCEKEIPVLAGMLTREAQRQGAKVLFAGDLVPKFTAEQVTPYPFSKIDPLSRYLSAHDKRRLALVLIRYMQSKGETSATLGQMRAIVRNAGISFAKKVSFSRLLRFLQSLPGIEVKGAPSRVPYLKKNNKKVRSRKVRRKANQRKKSIKECKVIIEPHFTKLQEIAFYHRGGFEFLVMRALEVLACRDIYPVSEEVAKVLQELTGVQLEGYRKFEIRSVGRFVGNSPKFTVARDKRIGRKCIYLKK